MTEAITPIVYYIVQTRDGLKTFWVETETKTET